MGFENINNYEQRIDHLAKMIEVEILRTEELPGFLNLPKDLARSIFNSIKAGDSISDAVNKAFEESLKPSSKEFEKGLNASELEHKRFIDEQFEQLKTTLKKKLSKSSI